MFIYIYVRTCTTCTVRWTLLCSRVCNRCLRYAHFTIATTTPTPPHSALVASDWHAWARKTSTKLQKGWKELGKWRRWQRQRRKPMANPVYLHQYVWGDRLFGRLDALAVFGDRFHRFVYVWMSAECADWPCIQYVFDRSEGNVNSRTQIHQKKLTYAISI